jgi:hypothetical protein
MNLSMYIIVSTISSAQSQQTQNYFKDQIEGLRQTMVNSGLQHQQNLLNQINQSHTDLLNQMKESAETMRKGDNL